MGVARMHALLAQPWVGGTTNVASSLERKACDGANMPAATGHLPKHGFEALADAFFANPNHSMQGWKRAADAQARVVGAVRAVPATAPAGDVAIISHGGVGALLLCHLCDGPISRAADQPLGDGGYFLRFDRITWRLQVDWTLIAP